MARSSYTAAAVLLVAAWLLRTQYQELQQSFVTRVTTNNPWLTEFRDRFDAFVFLPLANKIPLLGDHGDASLGGAHNGDMLSEKDVDPTCVTLHQKFPEIAHLPGSVGYIMPPDAYWTAQAASLAASCVVRPRNASEVGAVVKLLKTVYDGEQSTAATFDNHGRGSDSGATQDRLYRLRFAVKSGGHSVDAGMASIDAGILLDLIQLDTVHVSSDQATAAIGVGARWGTVYDKLGKVGLAVVGGRDSHVGVGGYMLGGGISFFSPRFGMACDRVVEYEVVLADGRLVRATQSNEHADLWRALKGGGGNFGIVTSIVAETFPSTKIWGGYVYWAAFSSTVDQLLSAMYDKLKPENFDEYAAGPIMGFGYIKLLGVGVSVAASSVVYTKPEPWPPVWQAFNSIWRLWSTTKIQSLSDTANEMMRLSPFGHRRYMMTTTVKNDLATLKGIHAIWKDLRPTNVTGTIHSLVMQPLASNLIHRHAVPAPNVLGLETRNTTDSLVVVMMSHTYAFRSDDQFVYRRMRELISAMQDFARSRDTHDPYIYLNYAASEQDVFAGYGPENNRFMMDVSQRYDPDRFWQVAKQGGFKIEPGLSSRGREYDHQP